MSSDETVKNMYESPTLSKNGAVEFSPAQRVIWSNNPETNTTFQKVVDRFMVATDNLNFLQFMRDVSGKRNTIYVENESYGFGNFFLEPDCPSHRQHWYDCERYRVRTIAEIPTGRYVYRSSW